MIKDEDDEGVIISIEPDFIGPSVLGDDRANGLRISAVEGESGICRSPRDCFLRARADPCCSFGSDDGSNHRAVGVGGNARGSDLVICGILLGETGTGVTGVDGCATKPEEVVGAFW